ncbi:MAG TPA: hypothetical protein PLJ47_17675 [Candidatus Hydrogenedentes bacterium]|nr:hypothetical protein [Candidatus Hydrogenedentota bacterium]
MSTLEDILYALSILASFSAMVLLAYLLWRTRMSTGMGARDDIASMMFLLQTMRDLLEQQKSLARDFNKAMDSRVEQIQQSVETARAEANAARDSIAQVTAEIERVRANVGGIHQANAPRQPSNVTTFTPVPLTPSEVPREHERPVLRVLALPREPEPTGDIIDAWVGLDFAGDEPDPLGFDVPEVEPEVPHDGDAARNAFRALLDMAPERPDKIQGLASTADPERVPHVGNGNGRPVPPVHARVYDYNDAGMTIPQIAQELGIGKGEVRLILSLRKTKDA